MLQPPRDLVTTASVVLAMPNPILVISDLVRRIRSKTYRKLDVKMLVYPGSVLELDFTTECRRHQKIPTLSHSLVEPGTTDLSGWRRTSSLRAVIFIDCNNFSYSPRLGSSPIPITMIQSAYGIHHISPGTGEDAD